MNCSKINTPLKDILASNNSSEGQSVLLLNGTAIEK
jgi:hypothetical protein